MKCFKPCDVFISHAFEDKADVSDELHQYLEKIGVRTWYSGAELMIGENIHTAIDKGLKKCRNGLVILSPNYIGNWPEYELYRLLTTHKTVLPIWYKLSKEDIQTLYPSLISIYAIPIEKGIPYAAKQVKRKVKNLHPLCAAISFLMWLKNKYRKRIQLASLVILLVSISYLAYECIDELYPDPKDVETGIAAREHDLATLIANHIKGDTSRIPYEKLQYLTKDFNILPLCQPDVEFTNGTKLVRKIMDLKQLNLDAHQDLDAIHRKYSARYSIYLLTNTPNDESDLHYLFLSKDSIQHSVTDTYLLNSHEYHLKLGYSNSLRAIFIRLHRTKSCITAKILYIGFKPEEELILEKVNKKWEFIGVY